MLNFWHDTGPPTTSCDSTSSESIPDADSSFESTTSLKMRQKRRSRWRHSTDSTNSNDSSTHSNQSFISCKFLLFILALASLPLCSTGRTTSAPSFKSDPSVLATFTDNYENKDVELEKMIMDPLTNRLYIGGVNHLYDLSPVDLQIREHSVTGPRPDSILCAVTPFEPIESLSRFCCD
ncbi:Sema domain-containing protein [Aphelenchoides bicaudatus]|nr:Sema domain-containing protein [Aphelenchoides bicaudatus]